MRVAPAPAMQAARSLEIEEDLDYQRGEWKVARVTAVVLLLVMAATALGAFGDGPLSRARAGEQGAPLWVEYDRICRFGASTRFLVHVRPAGDGSARFALERAFLERYQVSRVTPEPASTALTPDAVEYRFDALGTADVLVVLDVEPAQRGISKGAIRGTAAEVELRQLVLP